MKTTLSPERVLFFIALLIFLTAFIGMLVNRAVERNRLRAVVYNNLDAALGNGQFAWGGNLSGATSAEIACDLTCYAWDLENETVETLEPYVKEWIAENPGVCGQ